MKKTIIFFLILFSGYQIFADEAMKRDITASRFGIISTALLSQLFQWPDEATLNGKKAVEPSAGIVRLPKNISWMWIKKIFNESWQPPQNAQMFFLRKEFNGRDVTRVAWQHDGYRIEVSQTSSVFAAKIIPQIPDRLGSDNTQRFQIARQLCRQIFAHEGKMWSQDANGSGIATSVPELNKKILEFSFDEAKINQTQGDNIVFGNPKTMKDEGVAFPSLPSNRPSIASLTDLRSWVAWYYWFRNVNWWNDGQAVGFYFLKIEGLAAWTPLYFDENDKRWFDIPRDRSGRPIQTILK